MAWLEDMHIPKYTLIIIDTIKIKEKEFRIAWWVILIRSIDLPKFHRDDILLFSHYNIMWNAIKEKWAWINKTQQRRFIWNRTNIQDTNVQMRNSNDHAAHLISTHNQCAFHIAVAHRNLRYGFQPDRKIVWTNPSEQKQNMLSKWVWRTFM